VTPPTTSQRVLLLLAAALALVACVVLAIPADDGLLLATIAFGTGVGAWALGRAAARLAGGRFGVVAATAIVAAVPLVAVTAGTVAAARAMFVSTHDLSALVVVLVAAGAAGGLGALSVAGDLTAAQRSAEEARRRERLAEGSRRELVAWVSHDLRTPLSAARAMIEALEDGVVTDEATVARYHRQIGLEIERLGRLVDDLFELARLQAGALSLDLQPVPLPDLVAEAMASLAAVAQAKGVRVDGPQCPGATEVTASPRELTRVVHNLIDNAIRHTPPGGAVRVGIERTVDCAVVSVRDGCGGIADESIDRVFELAFRGDAARSSGGGGLGLAIARGLVEAHAGDIAVVNEDDGCRFTVRLPLA
jgi:signal transduction histidine kinase